MADPSSQIPFSDPLVASQESALGDGIDWGKPGGSFWHKSFSTYVEASGLHKTWPVGKALYEFQLHAFAFLLGWSARETEVKRQLLGVRWRGHGWEINPQFQVNLERYADSRTNVGAANAAINAVVDGRLRKHSTSGTTHHQDLLINAINESLYAFSQARIDSSQPSPPPYGIYADPKVIWRGKQNVWGLGETEEEMRYEETHREAWEGMLISIYKELMNGKDAASCSHYHSLVDKEGRPLRPRDIIHFVNSLAEIGRSAAAWNPSWEDGSKASVPKVSRISTALTTVLGRCQRCRARSTRRLRSRTLRPLRSRSLRHPCSERFENGQALPRPILPPTAPTLRPPLRCRRHPACSQRDSALHVSRVGQRLDGFLLNETVYSYIGSGSDVSRPCSRLWCQRSAEQPAASEAEAGVSCCASTLIVGSRRTT